MIVGNIIEIPEHKKTHWHICKIALAHPAASNGVCSLQLVILWGITEFL